MKYELLKSASSSLLLILSLSEAMDEQMNAYLRYYSAQSGGRLDPYSGARRGQYGNGLGDILRGLLRTVLPIAAHGASTFLGETLRNKAAGARWKDAARGAVSNTAKEVLDQTVDRISSAVGQKGSGRKRRRTRLSKTTKAKRRRRASTRRQLSPQFGGRRRRVYKRKRTRKPSIAGKRKKKSTKRIRFLNF